MCQLLERNDYHFQLEINLPYFLVISYEFKIREKIINPKDNRHSDRKKVSALHQGDTIPELCCFHALYQMAMRMYESVSKIKFMHGSDQAKKTSSQETRMQRRPAALGGWDKFTGVPRANVSPMQHICTKNNNYMLHNPLKF